MGLFSKIFGGLKKTKDAIKSKLSSIFVGELDEEFYEELEFVLLSSDIGASATDEIIENVRGLAKKQKVKTEEEFYKLLKQVMLDTLIIEEDSTDFPKLITFVGVNGVGKTTTIGRLANYYKSQNKSVLLVAGERLCYNDPITQRNGDTLCCLLFLCSQWCLLVCLRSFLGNTGRK